MDISRHTRTRGVVSTPQSAPIPGQEDRQVENSAGGFIYSLDKWKRLERFLILGTDGGTYYASERDITQVILEDDIRRIELNLAQKKMTLHSVLNELATLPKETPCPTPPT